jgi:16S rRNA (guanine1516-N2)-methyltransferase
MTQVISVSTVGYEDDSVRDRAEVLADRLGYKLDKEAPVCLYVSREQLFLKTKNFAPLAADFSAATWHKRKAEGKKQAVVRACKPAKGIKIIDATGGWGRDAAILASYGAELTLLERNPLMAVLLEDALAHRSEQDKELMHVSLVEGDAIAYLRTLNQSDFADVVYIDPMHPVRSKSALVKKDMQILQQIVGPDEDAVELIQMARIRVKQRVVVKWPQKIKALLAADACIDGKTVRFDIYK